MTGSRGYAGGVTRCSRPPTPASSGTLARRPPTPQGRYTSLLWEADPRLFAERYPDSGILESYGVEHLSDVSCIDYWIYVDEPEHPGQMRLSWEGWHLWDEYLPITGDADVDGRAVARRLAEVLRVSRPDAGG